jgi:hypothetical protein
LSLASNILLTIPSLKLTTLAEVIPVAATYPAATSATTLIVEVITDIGSVAIRILV